MGQVAFVPYSPRLDSAAAISSLLGSLLGLPLYQVKLCYFSFDPLCKVRIYLYYLWVYLLVGC